jgi:uncharacterized protein YdiU (UPF0061 family)
MALAQDLLDRMAKNKADFTLTFRRLSDSAGAGPDANGPIRSLFDDPAAFDGWAAKWRQRLAQEGGTAAERRAAMRAVNPAFIPRNHRVEAAIAAAQNGCPMTIGPSSRNTPTRQGQTKWCARRSVELNSVALAENSVSRQIRSVMSSCTVQNQPICQ